MLFIHQCNSAAPVQRNVKLLQLSTKCLHHTHFVMWTRLAVKKERIEPYEYWVRSTLLAAFDVIELRPDALDRLEAFHGDACALHKSSLTSLAQDLR